MRLTSTAAIGFCTRPTIVTSLMVTMRGFFCARAVPGSTKQSALKAPATSEQRAASGEVFGLFDMGPRLLLGRRGRRGSGRRRGRFGRLGFDERLLGLGASDELVGVVRRAT